MGVVYSLYDALVSIHVPEEKTKAVIDALEREMMDKLATKADLTHVQALLARDLLAVRIDLGHGLEALRSDTAHSMKELRTDMTREMAALRSDMGTLEAGVGRDMEALRTNISLDMEALRTDMRTLQTGVGGDMHLAAERPRLFQRRLRPAPSRPVIWHLRRAGIPGPSSRPHSAASVRRTRGAGPDPTRSTVPGW